MDKFMQWFKSNGDHFLNSLSVFLLGGVSSGLVKSPYIPMITAVLAALHTIFIPDQPVSTAKPTTPPVQT